jgi:DNA-binding IclR family transcriptional regulator
VFVSMRHGTVMSLRGTASGRLFAAWMPAALVQPVLRAELRADRGLRESAGDWAAALQAIRADGLSRARDLLLPGISALAAPVFDGSGTLALSLTTIGTTAGLDTALDGTPARVLVAVAGSLSKQLGARGR